MMRINHLAAAFALVSGGVVAAGCGSSTPSTTTTTKTATTTTTTQAAPSTTGATGTTVSPTAQPATAVWPFASSSTRYSDPVAAATGFATTYLGFAHPVIGAFQQGDNRSGEVQVRPGANGMITTVFLRQLGADNTWWVLGATTAHLVLDQPKALATISSPVTLQGSSTAFEGTVNVEIRQDGTLTPLTTGYFTGGGNGKMGPFSKAFSFPTPSASAGAIVLKTLSARDGTVAEATVVRVAFP